MRDRRKSRIFLNIPEVEVEVETKKEEEAMRNLKRVVKELQLVEDAAKRRNAAVTVRFLVKEDIKARITFAILGAIPPPVALLDSKVLDSHIVELYALLNLGIGNDASKKAIVKVGSVHKMWKLIESTKGVNSSVTGAVEESGF